MAIEFFANGGADTPLILIYGYSVPSARELFHAVRSLKEEREEAILVHALPGYAGIDDLQLTFKVTEESKGVQRHEGLNFSCELTPDGWDEVEFRLSPFCDRYASPGEFQWLDSKWGNFPDVFHRKRVVEKNRIK